MGRENGNLNNLNPKDPQDILTLDDAKPGKHPKCWKDELHTLSAESKTTSIAGDLRKSP